MTLRISRRVHLLYSSAIVFSFLVLSCPLTAGPIQHEDTISSLARQYDVPQPPGPGMDASRPCPPGDLTGEGLPVFPVGDYGAQGTGETNDQPAIQAAIDAANSAGGGVVFVPVGDYRIDSSLVMKSDVILKGDGVDSVIFISGDFHCIECCGTEEDLIRNIAVRNIQLRGLGEPSSGASTLIAMRRYVDHAVIADCLLADSGYDGWHALFACTNIAVLNNHVVNAFDDGLNPGGQSSDNGTNDVLICGNVIESVAHDGIHISDSSYDIVAKNNTITGCGNGVGFYQSSDSLVEDNVITGCNGGIRTVSPPTPNMQISGNEITDSVEQAIYVFGQHCDIRNNVIEGGTVGIEIESYGGIVADNTITNADGLGIAANGGAAVADVHIVDNDIHSDGDSTGIWLNVSCSTIARNCVREAELYSIFDNRGYNRVVMNDVDGAIESLPGDTNCDESIDLIDLLAVLEDWGSCDLPIDDCFSDVDGNGAVNTSDLLIVIAHWGQ